MNMVDPKLYSRDAKLVTQLKNWILSQETKWECLDTSKTHYKQDIISSIWGELNTEGIQLFDPSRPTSMDCLCFHTFLWVGCVSIDWDNPHLSKVQVCSPWWHPLKMQPSLMQTMREATKTEILPFQIKRGRPVISFPGKSVIRRNITMNQILGGVVPGVKLRQLLDEMTLEYIERFLGSGLPIGLFADAKLKCEETGKYNEFQISFGNH